MSQLSERLRASLETATRLAPIAGRGPADSPGVVGRLSSRVRYGFAQFFTARQKRFNLEITNAASDLAATNEALMQALAEMGRSFADRTNSLDDQTHSLRQVADSLGTQIAAARDPSFYAEGLAMVTSTIEAALDKLAAAQEKQVRELRDQLALLATRDHAEQMHTTLAGVAATVHQLRELAPDKPRPQAWLETTRDGFEAACRRGVRYYPLTSEIGVADILGCAPIFVRTADANATKYRGAGGIDTVFTPHLIRDGYWESWFTVAMMRHIKPGMRVADVGANCGYYTLLFGHLVGPTGKVLACEPNPALGPLVEMSARFNGLNHVEVYKGAVGDKSGTVELAVGLGMLNATILDVGVMNVPTTTVPLKPLDELFSGDRLDFRQD